MDEGDGEWSEGTEGATYSIKYAQNLVFKHKKLHNKVKEDLPGQKIIPI